MIAPRPVSLLGVKAPFVKNDGDIAVPVLTGSGETVELTASASLWKNIVAAVTPLHTAVASRDVRTIRNGGKGAQ